MIMLNMASKKQSKYKQRYFDQWKLFTLYSVGGGKGSKMPLSDLKKIRPDRYSLGQNSADSEFMISNFSSGEKSEKDYLNQ